MSENGGFVPEIEQNLLGAVLRGGDHRAALAALEPEQFVESVHGEVWRAARIAQEQYGTAALTTVARLLPAAVSSEFQKATGTTLNAYLAECIGNTLTGAAGTRAAARLVLAQWARLAIGREASMAFAAAADPGADAQHLSRTLAAQLDEITAGLRRGGKAKTLVRAFEAADAALADAREARQMQGLAGITTGLLDLDRATGGFLRRDLIVIAARPSMGKTTVATSISRAAARSGVGVGMFSLEMDAAKIGARYISDIALSAGHRIPYMDLIRGEFDQYQERVIEDAMAEYRSLPFWIEDQAGLSMTDIRVKAEAMMERAEQNGTPLGLIVVDHLGKVRPSQRYAGNRTNEIGEVTEGLKGFARDNDVAVLLLSQLNRGVEQRDDKRPQLMDLRDSGNIEQDADLIAFLYREAYYLENKKPDDPDKEIEWEARLDSVRRAGELAIAKQRNGPLATIDLFMDVSCSAVRNAARLQ